MDICHEISHSRPTMMQVEEKSSVYTTQAPDIASAWPGAGEAALLISAVIVDTRPPGQKPMTRASAITG
jgi:hypothetical protein